MLFQGLYHQLKLQVILVTRKKNRKTIERIANNLQDFYLLEKKKELIDKICREFKIQD